MLFPPLAVHISADVLSGPAMLLGYVALAGLLGVGLFRVHEDEIARLSLMSATFFIASSIHLPLWPTSVHLLLNGLVGIILGRRACVAIPVGLLLQAALLGHGSLGSLGVNSCVMVVPALLARPLFHTLVRDEPHGVGEAFLAFACLLSPWLLLAAAPFVFAFRRLGRGMGLTASFRAGFIVGALSVLLTSVLHSLALVLGGTEDWSVVAVLSLTVHLPLALVEGLILGTVVDALMKVKPSLVLPDNARPGVIPAEKSRPAAPPTAPTRH